MSAILCDESDIKKRLGGRDLSTAEQAAWPGLAEEATAAIEGYLNQTWDAGEDPAVVPDTVPRNVRVVASRMVARTLTSPQTPAGAPSGAMIPGTRSFNSSMGPLGHTTTFGDDVVFGSPWLSKADKIMLRRKPKPVMNFPMYDETAVGDRLGRDFAERYGY